MLIWGAIPTYLLAGAMSWWAARCVARGNGPPADRRVWLAIALLFVFMTVNRLFDLEETGIDYVRDLSWRVGGYGERRSLQAPLAAAVVVLVGLALGYLLRPATGRRPPAIGRALLTAKLCGAGLVGLVALRTLSFHATDALLFGGPHINRVLDPGLSLGVALGAWQFVREIRRAQSNAARSGREGASVRGQ